MIGPMIGPMIGWYRAGRTVLALALGGIGGSLFSWLHLPMPWMLGAIVATTLAAAFGLPVAVPGDVRRAMLAVLGTLLGCAFTPAALGHAGVWWLSLVSLIPLVAACTGIGMIILRRWVGYDVVTSYFTATPGGLNEMVAVGTAMGGDERTIALSHSLRVFLVVMVIPLSFQLFGGYQPAARGPLGPSLAALSPTDALMLGGCLLGVVPALRLRLPAAVLLGPMLVSAVLHASGLTTARPPGLLVALAQLVIGAAIGSRFAGVPWAIIRRQLSAALALTVTTLTLSLAAAALLSQPTGVALSALVLAFAPGGLAEMSLVAMAMGLDVAFVSTHHVVRVLLIVMAAPVLFSFWRRRAGAPSAGDIRPS